MEKGSTVGSKMTTSNRYCAKMFVSKHASRSVSKWHGAEQAQSFSDVPVALIDEFLIGRAFSRKMLHLETDGIVKYNRHMVVKCSWMFLVIDTQMNRGCGIVVAKSHRCRYMVTRNSVMLGKMPMRRFSDMFRSTLRRTFGTLRNVRVPRRLFMNERVRPLSRTNPRPQPMEPIVAPPPTFSAKIVSYFNTLDMNSLVFQTIDLNVMRKSISTDPFDVPKHTLRISAYATIVSIAVAFTYPSIAMTINMQYCGTMDALRQLDSTMKFPEVSFSDMIAMLIRHIGCYIIDLDHHNGIVDFERMTQWMQSDKGIRIVLVGNELNVSISIIHLTSIKTISTSGQTFRYHFVIQSSQSAWYCMILDK